MADTRPWGPNEPNSTHQQWSSWTFVVQLEKPAPEVTWLRDNFRRWIVQGFRTRVGEARVDQVGHLMTFQARVEGPPITDPMYRARVRAQFADVFVRRGFGPSARLRGFDAALLCGASDDGKPPTQLLVLPTLVIDVPTTTGAHVDHSRRETVR